MPASKPSFPDEILKNIIECSYDSPRSKHADLKQIRLVNKACNDFATPLLFDHAHLSFTLENLENIKTLIKSPHVRQHVKTLYVDASEHQASISTSDYALQLAEYLERFFRISERVPQESGPFTAQNLEDALSLRQSKDPSLELGPELTLALHQGYSQYHARSEYWAKIILRGDIDDITGSILDGLPKLQSVCVVTCWSSSNCRAAFRRYMRGVLRNDTAREASGLMADIEALDLDREKLYIEDRIKKDSSPYTHSVPGVSARNLHPLHLPPRAPKELVSPELVRALIQGLGKEGSRLCELSLPGRAPWSVKSSSLDSGTSISRALFQPTCSEQLFRNLRQLRLVVSTTIVTVERPCTLARLIQCMGCVEEMNIAMSLVDWDANRAQPSLRNIFFLRSQGGIDDGAEDAHTSNDHPGDTTESQIYVHETGENEEIGASQTAESSQTHETRNTPENIESHSPSTMGIHLEQVAELISVTTSPLRAEAPSTPLDPLESNHGPRPPDAATLYDSSLTPLPVSLWPSLHTLRLGRITASRSNLIILLKTLAPTLRSLTLHRVVIKGRGCHWGSIVRSLRAILSVQKCSITLSSPMADRLAVELGGVEIAERWATRYGMTLEDALGEFVVTGESEKIGAFPFDLSV